jgi:CRP-like cAMP-binding protein
MPPSRSQIAFALRYLLREANKAGVTLSNAFVTQNKKGPRQHYVKGIRKGNFYKRRLVHFQKQPPPASVPKLPPLGPQTMPQPLKRTPLPHHSHTPQEATPTFFSRAHAWLQQNAAVLVLNFGSLCTLTAFTRSDVLELRAFSMTGSISSVLYFSSLKPLRWAPIAWSSLFATVNAVNIYKILYERNANVVLSQHEEDIFVEHFMPHGVTPKQFEKICSRAKTIAYKKGELMVKQGDPLKHVYLVVKGRTRANYMGRRLTAVSSAPGYREKKIGGDSGAWIGEMTFLESFGLKEMKKTSNKEGDDYVPLEGRRIMGGTAIYTIVAASDCEVLAWSHEDIEQLMMESTDIRAAMTRAMTAPIVGKVINFTLSMGNRPKTWSTWLDDWKYSGARVNVVDQPIKEGSDVEVEPVM